MARIGSYWVLFYAFGGSLSNREAGRNHVAADAASRQLKLRLRLRNRPSSVEFQSAQADFALVAATSVARCNRGSHNEIALNSEARVQKHSGCRQDCGMSSRQRFCCGWRFVEAFVR